MFNRRHILSLAGLAALSDSALAQDGWPQRPVRIINPGAPGGTNDVLSRHLTEPVGRLLGQSVIIESKAGAGGAIGAQFVAQQPADGYTLLTHHNGLVTTPIVRGNAGYDALKDFVPVSMQGSSPLILMAHPSMPATLAEFLAHARANPGKLEWGTAALGGVGHLATEVFHNMAGIKDMVRVAFSGSAPASQALLGGQIKYLMSTPSAATAALVQDGRMRYLGVSSPTRSPLLPDVPAMAEAVPGFSAEAWFGLFARSGTPPAVLARLSEAFSTVVATPDIAAKYRGVNVVARAGARELGELIRREHDMWSKVVKDNNIKVEG